MGMSEKIELHGLAIELTETKSRTNTIRQAFAPMALGWASKIHKDFGEMFSGLGDLYQKSDDLANAIRRATVDEAVKILVDHGVYELGERQFYEQFMHPYDSWDEDVEELMEQYEAIAERSAALDAHRTARRQNRSQWVGYGSKQSVYEADAKNLMSNIGHGVFNLMAKGVSAVGDSLKKDEIFKAPGTVQRVAGAAESLVLAGFQATLAAINDALPGTLHDYSNEEVEKSRAILEHIEKGRISEQNIALAVVRSLQLYPYNREAYSLLLRKFGADQGRLDGAVAHFGLPSLLPEKRALMDVKLREHAKLSADELKTSLPELESYASHLCYPGLQEQWQRLLQRTESVDKKAAQPIHVASSEPQKDGTRPDLAKATQGLKSNKEQKFYVTPDLPAEKLGKFLEKNKIEKSANAILFYFDDTVFGSGDAGVAVDFDHINARQAFCEVQRVALSDVERVDISGVLNKTITLARRDGSKVAITLSQSNNGAKTLSDAIRRLVEMRRSAA